MKFDALPIAHFEDNVPHFLKHMLKLAIPLKIWVPAPSEVSLCRICSPKIAVFRPFFGRKWSLTAKPSTFDPIVLYIIGHNIHIVAFQLKVTLNSICNSCNLYYLHEVRWILLGHPHCSSSNKNSLWK